MLFRTLLALHLLAAVAFFSNLVAALFWKSRADRSRLPEVVAHTFRSLDASDRWITSISSALLVATGIGLALVAHLPLLGTGWLAASIASFGLSGVVFVVDVLPRQQKISSWTTEAAGRPDFDWDRYRSDARRWARSAHASLALALVALLLMVWKPGFPGL